MKEDLLVFMLYIVQTDSESLGSALMKEDLQCFLLYIVQTDSKSLGATSMKEDLLVFDVVYCLDGQ